MMSEKFSDLMFTDTTIRMAVQMLPGFDAKPDILVPILEQIDGAGFGAAEVWGGSSFDISLRYLNDDPWKRLRWIKKRVKNTPLQMLVRGQNLLAYKNFGHDILDEFFLRTRDNGIKRIRTFDALNDISNLLASIETAKKYGLYIQVQLCYTRDQRISLDHYLKSAKKLESLGVDSIGLMDLSGTLDPQTTTLLILNLKRILDIPVCVHIRAPGGGSYLSNYAAITAGVDMVDCSLAPIALHAGQPSFDVLLSILKDSDISLNAPGIREMTKSAFPIVLKKRPGDKMDYLIETSAVSQQLPTGVIRNAVTLLLQHGAIYRFKEILDEIKLIREEMGSPALITPVSQLVSTQAVYNILLGERYKIVPKEVRYYFEGWYGLPPLEMNEKIVKKVLQKRKPLTRHVSKLLPDRLKKIKKELDTDWVERDEDYVTYALFPRNALRFFKWRKNPLEFAGTKKDKTPAVVKLPSEEFSRILSIEKYTSFMEENNILELSVEDQNTSISINRSPETMSGQAPLLARPVTNLSTKDAAPGGQDSPTSGGNKNNYDEIVSPMVGVFYTSPSPESPPYVKIGDTINAGQVLCIIEAMKLFNEIKAEISGVLREICVKNEEVIQTGQPIFRVEKS